MKKILYSILITLMAGCIYGVTTVFGAEFTEQQKTEIINRIPDEITLDIKESEYFEDVQRTYELIYEKLTASIGKDIYFDVNFWDEETRLWSIREVRVYIAPDDQSDEIFAKKVKITYSNSNNYNKEDEKYVEDVVRKTNFHRVWEFTVNQDGSMGEWADRGDFSWNKLIGVDDISIHEQAFGITGDYFKASEYYQLYLFKNDVLYKGVAASLSDSGIIIVPDNIEETDEAYINYARPTIEAIMEGTIIKSITRYAEDYKGFTIKYTLKDSQEEYEEEIRIAKKDEYRCKLVPILQELSVINKENNNYLKGKLKITETEIGYDTHISKEHLPKITLIDNSGKKYDTTVTRENDDYYYFEIPVGTLNQISNYKIQASPTDPNNKCSNNNVDAKIDGQVIMNTEDFVVTENKGIANLSFKNQELPTTVKVGDVDGSGKITTKDAKMVLQHIVKKIKLTSKQQSIADVSGDGNITTKDAKLILQWIVKKINKFPVEE